MPGRVWQNSRKDIRDLNSRLSAGATVYTVAQVARSVAPYEDGRLYSEHIFERRSKITGEWMTGHLSVSGLLAQSGRIYEQPPTGVRNVAGPGPQVASPLGDDHSAYLDDAEIRGMEKHAAQVTDPRVRRIRGRRV